MDNTELPEHTTWAGRTIEKGGWRRPLKLLLKRGIVTRNAVEKVFGIHVNEGWRRTRSNWVDPIEKALKEARAQAKARLQAKTATELADEKDGRPINYYDIDDLLQIHKMRKKARGEE